jgi:hypothetical protein
MKMAIALVALCGVASAEKAADMEPPPQAGARAPRPMPLPPQPPKPAPEIAKLGKDSAGAYKCKGVQLRRDGSSTPMQATLTIELALDGAWVQASLAETGKPNPLKFVQYTTYDGVAKQWTRIQLASTSGYVVSTSPGEKSGQWSWEGTATSPLGTLQLRDHEQYGANQLKVWGEGLLGGSWQKLYEVTCAR